MMWRALTVLLLAGLLACESAQHSGATPVDIERACDAVSACLGDEARSECEEVLGLYVVTRDCADAVEQATCEEHEAALPPYEDMCLPRCDKVGLQHCQDDSLTGCLLVEGQRRHASVRCAEACAREGLAYTGTCGAALGRSGEYCHCE